MTLISGGYKDSGVLNDRPAVNKSRVQRLHFAKAERKIATGLTMPCIVWKNAFTLITSKLKVRDKL